MLTWILKSHDWLITMWCFVTHHSYTTWKYKWNCAAGLCCIKKTHIERTSENFKWSQPCLIWRWTRGLQGFCPGDGNNESVATSKSNHSYPISYVSEVISAFKKFWGSVSCNHWIFVAYVGRLIFTQVSYQFYFWEWELWNWNDNNFDLFGLKFLNLRVI